MAQLKIDLIVDSKGAIQIEKFGVEAEKALAGSAQSAERLNRELTTVISLSQRAQNALSMNFEGSMQRFANNVTALNSAGTSLKNMSGRFGSEFSELAKHANMTESEMKALQARLTNVSAARAQEQALKQLATQLNLTEKEMRDLGRRFNVPTDSIDRAAKSFAAIGDNGKKKMDLFGGSIAMAAGKFLLLEQAAYSFQRILNATVFGFNATVETATLGISAAFINNGEYIDDITGKVLQGKDAMKAAMRDADTVIQQLRASNLVTIATLEQLIKAYQEAAPVALSRGFNKDQVEQFTVAMMQAAGAIDTTGMLMNQMGEEMRSLLNGGINPKNTRIATALGITNEDIKRYQGDVQGLFDFIMSKLAAYQAFGDELQKTWKGVASNATDVFQQMTAKATEPLFVAVRDGLYDWQQGIAKIVVSTDELGNTTRRLEWNQEYVRGVERVKSELNDLIALLSRNKSAFGDAFDDMKKAADGAWRSLKVTAAAVGDVYSASSSLLNIGAFEWGVIGYVLFRGGAQAAALTGAMAVVNANLKEFNLNLGSIPGKYADMMSAWEKLGKSADEVISGKRRSDTGNLVGVSVAETAIDSLSRTLEKLEAQKKLASESPFIANLFGKGDVKKFDEDIAKVNAAITSVQDQAKKSGGVSWSPKITVSPEEREKLEKEIKDRQEAFERGRKAALKYSQTQREALDAEFKEMSKYLVPGSEEMKKAEDMYKQKVSDLNEREAKASGREAKSAAKEQNKIQKEYDATLDRLLPLRAAQRDYQEGLEALNKMDPTKSTEEYALGLANLKEQYDRAAESADILGRKKRELAEAMAAQAESEISRKETSIQISIAQGNMTEVGALPFQIDLLKEKLKIQQQLLAEMKKGSPEEINAWNSQAEAIANTTLELAEYQQRLRLTDTWEAVKQGLSDVAENAVMTGDSIRSAISGAFSSIDNAITDFVMGTEVKVENLVNAIIADFARIAIQKSITGPLASGLSGMLGGLLGGGGSSLSAYESYLAYADGGVVSAQGLSSYSGSVVSQPTVFPFASGIGLMGEAGPEAILPLKRLGSGKLGVESSGSSANVVINVIEAPGKGGEQQQRQVNGVNFIDVFVERIKASIASDIATGGGIVPTALANTYGLNRATR